MKKPFLKVGAVLVGSLFLSLAFAQTSAPVHFTQVLGQHEFSGQMIVKPMQLVDAIRVFGNLQAAKAKLADARARLAMDTDHYIADTDEYLINLPKGATEDSYANALLATKAYQYVEPNWMVFPVTNPNDPQYPNQYHHPLIRSNIAWNFTQGDPNMIVALTDTGVDLNHPDLKDHLVPGYNAIDHLAQIDGGQVNDLNGHGTHTAGDAAAIGNNGVGVSGVGWNFRIMEIRVSNSAGGGSSIAALTEGARWAVDHGAKVISTSYSGVQDPAIETTGQYIRGKGSLYCYAAGNDGANLSNYQHPDVIVVSATDSSDTIAGFSARGTGCICAPGVNILSTTLGGGYGLDTGTSMATPITAGACAMIFSANESLTPKEAETLLYSTSKDLGAAGNDGTYGFGRIDIGAAVTKVFSTAVNPTSLTIEHGNLVSGGVGNLPLSDDSYLTVQAGITANSGDAPISLILSGTSPTATSTRLNIQLENHASFATLIQSVELFDFTANAYVAVDTRNATTSDTVVSVLTTNPNRFIQAGTQKMVARVRVKPSGPVQSSNWTTNVDQLVWFVTP